MYSEVLKGRRERLRGYLNDSYLIDLFQALGYKEHHEELSKDQSLKDVRMLNESEEALRRVSWGVVDFY